MQSDKQDLGTEIQNHYEVNSVREITSILRSLSEKNQLIRMIINGGDEVIVTTILDIEDDSVIIDRAPDSGLNRRIIDASNISFETNLNRITILFSAKYAESCTFEDRQALRIELPTSLIRLQRREFYRINTPVTNPVRCSIPLAEAPNGIYTVPLVDISCGGIAILDEKKILDKTAGLEYKNCKIDLHGVGIIVTTLQVRNSQDMTLLNNKTNRRLGCQFMELPSATLSNIQRYIMKLERERNSKINGLG